MDRRTATDLTCQELVELVTDYLEGDLGSQERARFEAHLEECDGCRAYVDQMRATVDLTRAAGAAPASPPEMARLLDAFRGYRRV